MPKEKRHLDGGPLMPVSDPGEELHTPEYERRIAETLADRRPSRKDVLERAERREAMVRAIVTGSGLPVDPIRRGLVAENICDWADDLIQELDRREAAELQEARS